MKNLHRLDEVFSAAKRDRRAIFVPYIAAGDPNLTATEVFAEALFDAGADVLEIGVPFSDPNADGPTNQRAFERALKSGTSLRQIFILVSRLRARGFLQPIVLFSYFNPILKMGLEQFAKGAAAAGVTGVLVVDLPPEEAKEYTSALLANEISTIFLASPTTDVDRLKLINRTSTGFVYYVSRTGVTGFQHSISPTLNAELKLVRNHVDKPIVVGFGISQPDQAAKIAQMSDGIVVGSAIVKLIEESDSVTDARKKISQFALEISRALNKQELAPC